MPMTPPRPRTLEEDVEKLLRDAWSELVPGLDDTALNILGYFARTKRSTFYRAARELGLSFSVMYRKGRQLASLHLIHEAGDSFHEITAKGCIAGFVYNLYGLKGLIHCLETVWGLSSYDARYEEIVGFLLVLAKVLSLQGSNLVTSDICVFGEAAAKVASPILNGVIAYSEWEDANIQLLLYSNKLGINPVYLRYGVALALRGLATQLPPSIVTKNHKALVIVRNNKLLPIALSCNTRCSHYYRNMGTKCPVLRREVQEALRNVV